MYIRKCKRLEDELFFSRTILWKSSFDVLNIVAAGFKINDYLSSLNPKYVVIYIFVPCF